MKTSLYLLFISVFLYSSSNDQNRVKVSCDEELKLTDFTMELITNRYNQASPIYKGGSFFPIQNTYGGNDWILTYRDSICARFRHFKTEANATHDYEFHFIKKRGIIYCQVDIYGDTSLKQIVELKNQDCFDPNFSE